MDVVRRIIAAVAAIPAAAIAATIAAFFAASITALVARHRVPNLQLRRKLRSQRMQSARVTNGVRGSSGREPEFTERR